MNFHYRDFKQDKPDWWNKVILILAVLPVALALKGCTTQTTNQYEATALTKYTWQVNYSATSSGNSARMEEFASTSLLNSNGIKPEGAVTGPDDKGLWWTGLPPRPTVDEIERRQRPPEKASTPQLLTSVEYKIRYRDGDRTVTLPTNYDVYRQVVKAYPSQTPLHLTLGVSEESVEKAEPQQ